MSCERENAQAGCICCLGGPVFRTSLVGLLRQPAWKHLYLEFSREGEHLLRVVDQLREAEAAWMQEQGEERR